EIVHKFELTVSAKGLANIVRLLNAVSCVFLLLSAIFWFIVGNRVYHVLAIYYIVLAALLAVLDCVPIAEIASAAPALLSFGGRGILHVLTGIPLVVTPGSSWWMGGYITALLVFGSWMIITGAVYLAVSTQNQVRFPRSQELFGEVLLNRQRAHAAGDGADDATPIV
ncbi:hypothetical protein HDU83_008850, partial [Entophlyctis luteolus]